MAHTSLSRFKQTTIGEAYQRITSARPGEPTPHYYYEQKISPDIWTLRLVQMIKPVDGDRYEITIGARQQEIEVAADAVLHYPPE